MNRRLTIVILAFVLLGSLASLLLYNFGGYFLKSAFEIVNTEQGKAEKAAVPAEAGSAQEEGGERSAADQPGGTATTLPAQEMPAPEESGGENVRPEAPPAETGQSAKGQTEPQQAFPSGEKAEVDLSYSEAEMTEIQDAISAADKLSASVLVLSKLSPEDIKYLYGLMEGGLTPEEKKEAKSLCYSRFSAEEIAQIYELYTKYASITVS